MRRAALLLILGCGTSTGPDAIVGDAGGDSGAELDAEPEDALAPKDADLDAGEDTGARDIGFPDAGDAGPCPDGDEGCLCLLGGMCNDPGLECLDSSGGLVPPQDRLFLCVRTCEADADCLTSPVGNALCRPVFGGATACVSAEVQEGGLADISRLRQVPMMGCAAGLIGIPPFVGLRLEADQVSCGRPCDPNASSGPNTCSPAFPYCNPGLLNSQATPGLCMSRQARPGDTCSRSSVVGLCDRSQTPRVSCVGIPYSIDDPADPSTVKDPGMCMQSCDLATPDCAATDDPGSGPAACRQVNSTDTMVGVCTNDCTRFPSECDRTGAFGAGSSCTRELFFEMGYPLSFCFNVMTPPIAEWDFVSAPLELCLTTTGAASRCEAGTLCADDGNGGVCIRGCAVAGVPTGCESSNNPACNDAVFTGDGDGLGACTPQ